MAAGDYKVWAPQATPVREEYTLTIGGTWLATETITLTVGPSNQGADLVITIGSLVTTSQVATTVKQAIEAETLTDTTAVSRPTAIKTLAGQWANLTATVSGSVVTIVGDEGVPFTLTVAETSAAGTAVLANTEDATGPEHWDNADNWGGTAAPISDEIVVFQNSSHSCKYGLVTGIEPRSVIIHKSFTGQIGLPEINRDTPTLPYVEYLDKRLKFANGAVTATEIRIGEGAGNGSSLVRLDTNDCTSVEIFVYGTGSGIDGAPAVLLKGPTSNLPFKVHVIGSGSVGVGFYGDEETRVVGLIETVCRNASDIELILGDDCLMVDCDLRLYGGTVDIRNGDLSSITSGNYKLRVGNGTILKATLEP